MNGLFSVLRHRDFRLLWLAQSASTIGDRIVTVALALFVIDLTGSATDLGFVLAAHAVPLLGFMLLGGIWADRLPRHRLMVGTDLIRFALHAILAVLIVAGAAEIWLVVIVEALFGTAEAFFRPAATGLVPQTVPEAEIQEANALIGMVNNVSEFLGPALATVLVLGLGPATAFAVDAATFLLSAALLVRLRPRTRGASAGTVMAQEGERSKNWEAIQEGFHEVRSREWVWGTLLGFCLALFAGLAPWLVLGPVIAEQQYGDIAFYGIVTAALGIGTIAGSVIGISWRPVHPMRAGMIWASIWPLAAMLYALGLTLWLVIPANVVGGLGIALFDVWWMTALNERIPPDRLSRVSSYDWMVSLGLLPLGYLLAGPLARSLGAVEVLAAGSAIAFLALAATLLSRDIRSLERIEGRSREPITGERPGLPVP
ncbi:MAG: MFS transporter [Solirubrobacterales bacterium]|nr:MFS transporter [Solirubrobacterales bacterium]